MTNHFAQITNTESIGSPEYELARKVLKYEAILDKNTKRVQNKDWDIVPDGELRFYPDTRPRKIFNLSAIIHNLMP